MLRFVSVFAIIAVVAANYGGGHDDHYGGHKGHGYGHHDYHHKVDAPIKSYHSVHTYPVANHIQHAKVPVVDINSHAMPLKINFNSHSSHIQTSQHHYGTPGHHQVSHHVDHPDVLVQHVKKPVIQEIHEVIVPYRHRTQEVKPVQEKVETIIPKAHGHGYGHHGGHGYGHHDGGHGYGHHGGHKYGHHEEHKYGHHESKHHY